MNSQTTSPQLGKSAISSSTRREVLWNVVEPGDPYDIRRSMINSLPGKNDYFMGDQLEIVCLLQSAEIERLCEFLDDYKYRYRDMERRELDRHSYEIQIKELTQQLGSESSLQIENGKLKEFIKKLNLEIDELKGNKYNVDNNLRANYEMALEQVNIYKRQIEELQSEKETYLLQINNYTVRIQALESAKEKEIKELTFKFSEESRYVFEREKNDMKERHDKEIDRFNFEVKRLKEFNETKNKEIEMLNARNRGLMQELEEMSKNKKANDKEDYIMQLEERFALFGQEIERLNLRITESTAKIDESSRNEVEWKGRYERMERDYRESKSLYDSLRISYDKLKIDAGNSSQTINLENAIRDYKMQIESYEKRIEYESSRFTELQTRYSELEYSYSKISLVSKENEDMKASQANSQELKRKIAEYEAKVAILSQEIERLTNLNKNSNNERDSYDGLAQDYEEYKRKSIEKERSITQKYESEMQKRVIEYEARLAKYAEDSGNEFELRLQVINREVEKLNEYLHEKNEESENHKRRIRELENLINQKYEVEITRQYSTYENTIKELRLQNEDLIRKHRDFDGSNKKLAELENRIALLTQEIERLTFDNKIKKEENENLLRLNKQLELRPTGNLQEIEINRRITIYEENHFKLTRENEDLRRKLQEIVEFNRRLKEYEERIRLITVENDRLNQNLREKIEALNRAETSLRSITQEIEILRKNRLDIESSFSQKIEYDKVENSRKFSNYEQSLSSIQREYEELRRRMQDMGNDSNRKVSEYENRIVLMSQEIERLNNAMKLKGSDYEHMIQNLRNELELSLRQNKEIQVNITQKYEIENSRKISIYEQNADAFRKELEEARRRINEYDNILRKKSEEVNQLENRYKIVSQEYESYKLQVRNYEGEVNRSHSSFEQNISKVSRDYEELRRRVVEYENRIALLTQENERLNLAVRNGQIEQENLRRGMNELKIEITQKYEIDANRKTGVYEQNMLVLKQEREELIRRINEYENMIQNLNRELEERNRRLVEFESKYRELQLTVTNKYEVEVNRTIVIYEQNIKNLTTQIEEYKRTLVQYEHNNVKQQQELEDLRRRLVEYGDLHRGVIEYENKYALIRQELERVNANLKIKVEEGLRYQNDLRAIQQENEELRRKIKEVEISVTSSYQFELNQKSNSYEQNLGNYRRENDELKRRVAEVDSKLLMTTNEIERLNGVIKIKVEEANQHEIKHRNLLNEIENYKRKLIEVERSSGQRFDIEVNRTVSIYEQNITNITREFDIYKQDSHRKISEYETKIALLSQELERSSQTLRIKIEELERVSRTVREMEISSASKLDNERSTIISTYEQNISMVSRQYEEYKIENSRKASDYERRINMLTQEIENMRRQNKELEISFNQKYELEISHKLGGYEQNFTTLRIQIEEYERRNKELTRQIADNENKFALMNQEIERLNQVLKTKVDESKKYHTEMQKYAAEIENMKANISGYYSTEIEKLNSIIKQRNEEYQSLQIKFNQLHGGHDGEYKQLQTSYQLISKEYENSKKHLVEYEQSIRKLYSEFDRLQVIINELKVERQTLFEKNHGLLQEVERLTTENRDQETQLYEIRLKLSDDVALQKRIQEHLALMVVLFAEIETLRQRVMDKEKEVKEVRRSSLAPLKA